mgnify:CR=1 FL=1
MTERMEPLAPKVFKALLGMMEQTVLKARKGHRVCRAIPAHRGHKALPELLAHRVPPLFIQISRSRS